MKLSYAFDTLMSDVSKLGNAVLFGSRSMASRPAKENFHPAIMIGSQIDDSTDWDFSAPYTQENHDMLVSRGFMYWPPEELKGQDGEWKCPINYTGCTKNCGSYGCGN